MIRQSVTRQQRIKPAFTVQELAGEREVTHLSYEKGKRTEKLVKEPAGFLVRTFRGDSIRIRTEEELNRLGFGEQDTVPMLDSADADQLDPITEQPVVIGRSKN